VSSAVVVTALTVQDGLRVHAVEPVAPRLIEKQLAVVLGSMPVAAIKCGMLPSAAAARAVAAAAARTRLPLVLDPVMRSSGGQRLVSRSVLASLLELLRLVAVVTPNLDEAGLLAGFEVRDVETMVRAARRIRQLGARAVVVKGGHLASAPVDVLASGSRVERLVGPRLAGGDMHGTGCAFASALAAALAERRGLRAGVLDASAHVRALIRKARKLRNGALLRRS
jgi:hydroxymethylpyrimidine kinase/phosphomethylpyrimidine kinase